MWSMILLMSRLPGGRSMSAGRQPEKLGYQQSAGRHYQALVPTVRCDRRLGRSATRVNGPKYPGGRVKSVDDFILHYLH